MGHPSKRANIEFRVVLSLTSQHCYHDNEKQIIVISQNVLLWGQITTVKINNQWIKVKFIPMSLKIHLFPAHERVAGFSVDDVWHPSFS